MKGANLSDECERELNEGSGSSREIALEYFCPFVSFERCGHAR